MWPLEQFSRKDQIKLRYEIALYLFNHGNNTGIKCCHLSTQCVSSKLNREKKLNELIKLTVQIECGTI